MDENYTKVTSHMRTSQPTYDGRPAVPTIHSSDDRESRQAYQLVHCHLPAAQLAHAVVANHCSTFTHEAPNVRQTAYLCELRVTHRRGSSCSKQNITEQATAPHSLACRSSSTPLCSDSKSPRHSHPQF